MIDGERAVKNISDGTPVEVTVEFPMRVAGIVNEPLATIHVSSSLLLDVLREVSTRYPKLNELMFDENGRYTGFYDILLNGKATPAGAADSAVVREGDRITLVVQLQGG